MGDAGPAGADGTAGRQDAAGPAPARLPRGQPLAAHARAAKQWHGRPGWPAALESQLGPRFAAQGSWPRYQGDDDLLEMWQHFFGPDGAAQAAVISRERAARQHCGHAVQPPQSGRFGPGHGGSSETGRRLRPVTWHGPAIVGGTADRHDPVQYAPSEQAGGTGGCLRSPWSSRHSPPSLPAWGMRGQFDGTPKTQLPCRLRLSRLRPFAVLRRDGSQSRSAPAPSWPAIPRWPPRSRRMGFPRETRSC